MVKRTDIEETHFDPRDVTRFREKGFHGQPLQEHFGLSVSNLKNAASPDDPLYRWLWTRTPIVKIGYSILFTI